MRAGTNDACPGMGCVIPNSNVSKDSTSMKNIQVIGKAESGVYDVFGVDEQVFDLIFPMEPTSW